MSRADFADGGLVPGYGEWTITVRPLGQDADGRRLVSINGGRPELVISSAEIDAQAIMRLFRRRVLDDDDA